MNSTFKVVFNKARGALMVVNEATSSVQAKGTKTVIAAAVTAFLAGGTMAGDLVITNDSLPKNDVLQSETTKLVSGKGETLYIQTNGSVGQLMEDASKLNPGDGLTKFLQDISIMGSSSKTPVAKPDGTKMFCSAFLNDARMCCFFCQYNSKILT